MAFVRQREILVCLSCLILLSGCTSVLVTSASGGVAYTFTNVACKTIAAPLPAVEFANRLALMKLGIKQEQKNDTPDGIRILAVTEELEIYIDLEKITSKTTRMKVNAEKNFLVKDKATAALIIEQTEAMLEKQD